jgi:hypothetical protein
MKKHHLKHVGFLLAVLTLFASGIIALSTSLPTQAAGTETITTGFSYGAGGASIVSSPAGINCPGTCSYDFPADSVVSFTATPTAGRAQGPWTIIKQAGASSGNIMDCQEGDINYKGSTCSVNLANTTQGADIKAFFYYTQSSIRVKTAGTGSGTITSSSVGLSCTSDCTKSFAANTDFTLTAVASPGSTFAGWATNAEGGTQCIIAGKGGASSTRVTDATCQAYITSAGPDSGTAIAYFNKTTGGTAASGSGSSSSKPTTTSTPTPPADNTAQLTIQKVAINGKELLADPTAPDKNSTLSYPKGEKITLTGFTTPNAKVKLYIFSTPREAEVTSDAAGKWEYILTNMEAGDHHVEAAVTNPTTGAVGTRSTIATFAVASTPQIQAKAQAKPSTKHTGRVLLIVGILILAAAGYIGWYWWHHRKLILNHHDPNPPSPQT